MIEISKSNEINSSVSPISSDFTEPIMSKASPELGQDEFINRSIQILNEGVANHYSEEYVTNQLLQLASDNKNSAESLGFPTDPLEIRQKIVGPYYELNSSSDPVADCIKKNRATITGCGFSLLTLTPPVTELGVAGVVVSCGPLIPAIIECTKHGNK
jgi:hypothetical protein